MVTISLLEGDPEILTNWAKSFLSDDNINNTLYSMYNSLFDGVNTYINNFIYSFCSITQLV